MTNPVDDWGNPRVDFVYGNVPMQPDDQRTGGPNQIVDDNAAGNRGWSGTYVAPSDTLSTNETVFLSVGDQSQDTPWQEIDTRAVIIEADNHVNAIRQYEGFPAFIQGAPYDDLTPNVAVPDLVGMLTGLAYSAVDAVGLNYSVDDSRITGATLENDSHVYSQTPAAGTLVNVGSTVYTVIYEAPLVPGLIGLTNSEAQAALVAAGLVLGTSTPTSTGATSQNNGTVKTQSVASGTQVDAGTTVDVTIYNYVAANPIAGWSQASFPGHAELTGNDVYMFLLGRTVKPTVGSTITVTGGSNSSLSGNWTVNVVEDNDSYNSGGTVVTMTSLVGGVTGVNGSTGGTWITV